MMGKVTPVGEQQKGKIQAASSYDVYWLGKTPSTIFNRSSDLNPFLPGITIVIGGQITSWNLGKPICIHLFIKLTGSCVHHRFGTRLLAVLHCLRSGVLWVSLPVPLYC